MDVLLPSFKGFLYNNFIVNQKIKNLNYNGLNQALDSNLTDYWIVGWSPTDYTISLVSD